MIELLNWFGETWFRTIIGLGLFGFGLIMLDNAITNLCKALVARKK